MKSPFYEKEEEQHQNSKLSHPGLAAVLVGRGGGNALSIFGLMLAANPLVGLRLLHQTVSLLLTLLLTPAAVVGCGTFTGCSA